MWRRGDEPDARSRKAQAGDHVVDLVAGKLSALAGLGSLGDLDLQHLGVDQVLGGHAEAPGGHLLDLGVALGAITRRILAPLAGVGARTESVHGNRKRLVRLGRERAQGHAGAVEARQDGLRRLDLRERHRRRGALEREQVAERGGGALVHQAGEQLVVLIVPGDHRGLQGGDHVRVVHVVLAAVHVLEESALRDRLARIPRPRGELFEVGLEVLEVRAGHAARGAREAQLDHLLRQPHDLEQLRAAVTGDGGDAHLRHDLEQALSQARTVAAPELEARREVELHAAAAHHLEQHLVGHVRIHRGRPIADQAGEVMRLARGAGLDEQVALAAQAGLQQVLMHRCGHQQRVRGHAALDQVTVRQQQHELALAHRALRLRAQAHDRLAQALRRLVLQVDELVRDLLERQDLAQLPL